MKPLLYACGILALILGILIFGNAKSALHEIEAMVLMLIGAVLIVGGAVLGGIDRLMAAFLGPDIEGPARHATLRSSPMRSRPRLLVLRAGGASWSKRGGLNEPHHQHLNATQGERLVTGRVVP
jgi:hypothetical protein